MISISDISIIEDTDFFLMTILIKWTEKNTNQQIYGNSSPQREQ